jgi:peptidoglycan-N-acetylglucosamine deacetylase
MTHRPIFYDPSQRRSKRISIASIALAIFSTLLVLAFIGSVLVLSQVGDSSLSWNGGTKAVSLPPEIAKNRELLPAARRLSNAARRQSKGLPRSTHVQTMPVTPAKTTVHKGIAAPPSLAKPLTVGFYVNWDESSYASLKKALPDLDWVIPEWMWLHGPDMLLSTEPDRKSLDLIRRTAPQTSILPMLQNAWDGNWDGNGLAHLLADPARRGARLSEIITFLETNAFQGLTIDFERVPKHAQASLREFVRETHDAFKTRGLTLAIAVPFDDPEWDYRALGKLADYLILMAYDEHYEEGKPGPIASQGWFVTGITKRMKELDPAHTIVAIGNYGYDWQKKGTAQDLTFQESVLAALDSKATIAFDAQSLNPSFAFLDGQRREHHLWFLDAVTAYNQIHAADVFRPAGYALWRLGSEDPSIWPVLDHIYGALPPSALNTITPGNDVDFVGEGEILQIASEPKDGARSFAMDKARQIITSQSYLEIPTSYVIRRTGYAPGKIALTFDDGPSSEWTPQVLDILKEKGVKATFFIIGENGESNPGLLKRILAEGHEIGNHTFTHPNLGETPSRIAQIELNATQRLVEALTGRSVRLFRPPYFGDAEPTTSDEIAALREAGDLGYITVGLKIDPDDWQEPPAETIVSRVMEQLADPSPAARGQIILLHDAGGDRSQTVAALPKLIDQLRAKGLQIVPVSDLAGWTLDQVMPPVPPENLSPVINRVVFTTANALMTVLHWCIALAIALGIGRLVTLCGLALWGRSRARPAPPISDDLSVSVLIPAYNEASIITSSVRRILGSNFPRLEVIVIDDGSTDGTGDIVHSRFGDDPRVTLLSLANSGKAAAVNAGLARAQGDIVVALDADTQFEPDTIARLTRWFADPQIGAVAGNAKVGNRINTLTRWQALEYITAQNLERRALATLGCITVVPGAVGAWRRDALLRLGGFPSDTLAEDQDLTIAAQKAGWKVVFDPDAIAWTEAPDTLAGLAKQRFRWAFGTLQCLWKHGDAFLAPRYGALGLVAIPQIWLFQILLSLVSPFVDLMLISQIAGALIDYLQHGEQYDPSNLQLACFYYALFITADLAAGAIAFLFEKNENGRLLWWLALQRFGYRQLMYYVVVKSVISAAKGHFVGWGKLERKATVNALGKELPASETTGS